MQSGTLYAALSEVCPILTVTVGNEDDRSTWAFEPAPIATQQEKDAATALLQSISPVIKEKLSVAKFIMRWTNDEYVLLERERAADVIEGDIALAKLWDIATATGVLDPNAPLTKVLKGKLVVDEVLTQARADQIFS